jgi:hypothetical protein
LRKPGADKALRALPSPSLGAAAVVGVVVAAVVLWDAVAVVLVVVLGRGVGARDGRGSG